MQGIAQKVMADPGKYSIQELQQAVQSGAIPAYVAIPIIQDKVQQQKRMQQAAMMGQPSPQQQPTVAEQVMQEARGVEALPSNLPAQGYAPGGIIAFEKGGDVPTLDRGMIKALLGDLGDEGESEDDLDALIDAYMLPRHVPSREDSGIASLAPAATGASSLQYSGSEVSSKFGDEPKRTHGENVQTMTREVADPERLRQHVLFKESRGQRYDKEGKLLTSSKGAQGEMQVMPATARDPGFGIRPARFGDPEELARVGNQYLQAMLDRYGDPKVAAIAYNWGPGNTDKWLSAGADMARLPRETQEYIRGMAKGGEVESYQAGGMFPYNSPYAGKFSYGDAMANDPIFSWDRLRALFGGKDKDKGAETTAPAKTATSAKTAAAPDMGYVEPFGIDVGPPPPEGQPTSYGSQMGNVAGAVGDFLTSGAKTIVSAPGYGFSTVKKPAAAAPAGAPPAAPVAPAAGAGMPSDAEMDAAIKSFEGLPSTAGVAPGTTPAAPAAPVAAVATPSGYDAIMKLLGERQAALKDQAEQDKYMSLLAAGLGMMGGTSPYAAANIGTGAAQGVAAYAALAKQRGEEAKSLLSAQLMAERYRGLEDIRREQMEQLAEYRKGETERKKGEAATVAEGKRMAQLGAMEKAAESQAISIVGQDKLGAMDPAAARLAIAVEKDRILRGSATYRKLHKQLLDIDPYEGMGAGAAEGTPTRSWADLGKDKKGK